VSSAFKKQEVSMKAKLCLVASAFLFAGQALAEDAMTPKSDPGLPAPPPAAAEPAPAPAPMKDAATPTSQPTKEAATPAPAAAPQQQAEVPAEVVITELTETQDGKKMVQPWGLPAERVAEMDVYDAKGKKIGQVNAVLQDKNGEVRGIAVGYGGFLGFGEKGAILTLDRVKLKDGSIVTEINEDQLSQQPEWPHKK
jgi:sporulation protein YlmC with PRC-barrel domain